MSTRVLVAAMTLTLGTAATQTTSRTYADPRGRFTFDYPAAFGTPTVGTNDGYRDRVAAVRFSGLDGVGGEAVLTRGRVVVDLQALGGLYDPIALEAVPDEMATGLVASVTAVTAANFCAVLADPDHTRGMAGLSDQHRAAAVMIDRMRNIDPTVVSCRVEDRVAVFDKEVTPGPAASARQHVFGAVRFLDGAYSTFQIVRATPGRPSATGLDELTRLVRSFRQLDATRREGTAADPRQPPGVPARSSPGS